MARLDLIQVPYDCGRRGERLGLGPAALVDGGVAASLAAGGHQVRTRTIALEEGFLSEVQAATALQRLVAAAVREATTLGRLPVLFAGNCHTAAFGALGGLGSGTAALWLDAHGDFNTPETSPSGYFDGMSLAVATGRCFRAVAAGFDGFTPLADDHVALLGVRDLDALEAEALAASGIVRLEVGAPAVLGALLETWAAADRALYLHLDLDVLDPAELVCNPWPAPGGLTRAGLGAVLGAVARRLPPAAVGVTAYGPEFDRDGRGPALVGEALRALLAS